MGDIGSGLDRPAPAPTRDDVTRAAIWDALAAISARLDLVELWLTPIINAADAPPCGAGPDPEAVRHLMARAGRAAARAAESRGMMAAFHGSLVSEWDKRKAGQ